MNIKQRVNIKFCLKLQKSAKEAHEIVKSVNGDNVVTEDCFRVVGAI